jgi:nucleoside-triphosphatase THEP1
MAEEAAEDMEETAVMAAMRGKLDVAVEAAEDLVVMEVRAMGEAADILVMAEIGVVEEAIIVMEVVALVGKAVEVADMKMVQPMEMMVALGLVAVQD